MVEHDPVQFEALRRELSQALAAAEAAPARKAGLRAARQVMIGGCMGVLGRPQNGLPTLAELVRLVSEAPLGPGRRACAALLVHALAIRGLIPAALGDKICALAEASLRDVLLRGHYPFGASGLDRLRALQALHGSLADLMQPFQPTFPNWQGLYAG